MVQAFDQTVEQLRAAETATVRVYNNFPTMSGLAGRAADQLGLRGWSIGMVGDYNATSVAASAVYYRRGTDEVDAAQALAAQFGVPALERFPAIRDASPGLIVLVRDDWDQTIGPPPAAPCGRYPVPVQPNNP
ncbi:LytR C-terminal domain-containing protein [Actinomycetospora sp. C-140]